MVDHLRPKRFGKITSYFSILTFSSAVDKWTDTVIDDEASVGIFKGDHRMKATEYVNTLQPGGGTNINSALLEGIAQAAWSTLIGRGMSRLGSHWSRVLLRQHGKVLL